MSDTTTRGVRVVVQSAYVPERSSPPDAQYFFAYRIRISNASKETVQLLSRHWVITDSEGRVEHVRGPGVVGEQPVLEPGQSFEYTSGCPLTSPYGEMRGTYQMVTASGERFDAEIAPFTLDVLQLVRDEMQRVEHNVTSEVYRDGLTNVLAEPEFAEPEAARKALRVLEEPPFLEDLLNRTVLNAGGEGVQILIVGEGTWEELRDCSIVLARYGAPGQLTGAVGVIGPMRMAYGRSVSAVRFVSGLLSDLVVEMLAD